MWADYQEIQNLRVRIAMTGATKAQAKPSATSSGNKEYLCQEFNSRAGCKHRADHQDGNVNVLHLCAFCDAVNQQCVHSVVACERRLTYTLNKPSRPPPQYQQQQQQQWRAHVDGHMWRGVCKHSPSDVISPHVSRATRPGQHDGAGTNGPVLHQHDSGETAPENPGPPPQDSSSPPLEELQDVDTKQPQRGMPGASQHTNPQQQAGPPAPATLYTPGQGMGTAGPPPPRPATQQFQQPDFPRICKVCEKGNYETNIDLRLIALAHHRKAWWPAPGQEILPCELVKMYKVVRDTGLPNAMGEWKDLLI